jgi:beta-aspartyl-peptidase (threonine type)
MKTPYAIAIHGGAGEITRKKINVEQEALYQAALSEALEAGRLELARGGSAMQAVLNSIEVLENTPLFNAGKGSVFNHKGEIRMDAAIMDGQSLDAGAVANTRRVKNPIKLAYSILHESEHVFISGSNSFEFAIEHGLEIESEEYFHDEERFAQWMRAKQTNQIYLDYDEDDHIEKFGTVGAVALDENGNLAAGTSTGGMTNKKYGRIGDSPIIGSGTYAKNSTCAVSCTGQGEFFIRQVLAFHISCLMEYAGMSLKEACHTAVHQRLASIKGKGGLIAVDAAGNIEMPFNTSGMFRASQQADGAAIVKMFYD